MVLSPRLPPPPSIHGRGGSTRALRRRRPIPPCKPRWRRPASSPLRTLVKSCTRRQISEVHGLLLTSSLHRLPGLPALLVRRATDLGDMAHADQLFSSFHRDYGAPPDAALYNAMIRGCSYHGPHERALDMFEEMLHWCLATDGFNVVGDFVGLRRLFCRMPERNVVSWNWVLSSYTRHGRMAGSHRPSASSRGCCSRGLVPNSFTVVSVLSACQHLGKLRMGRCGRHRAGEDVCQVQRHHQRTQRWRLWSEAILQFKIPCICSIIRFIFLPGMLPAGLDPATDADALHLAVGLKMEQLKVLD